MRTVGGGFGLSEKRWTGRFGLRKASGSVLRVDENCLLQELGRDESIQMGGLEEVCTNAMHGEMMGFLASKREDAVAKPA